MSNKGLTALNTCFKLLLLNFFFFAGNFLYFRVFLNLVVFWSVSQYGVGLLELLVSPPQSLSLPYTGQHNKETPKTNIHTLSGTRTRDPVYESSKARASDSSSLKIPNILSLQCIPTTFLCCSNYGDGTSTYTCSLRIILQPLLFWSLTEPQRFIFMSV
jgi:hypothetical protein